MNLLMRMTNMKLTHIHHDLIVLSNVLQAQLLTRIHRSQLLLGEELPQVHFLVQEVFQAYGLEPFL